jgi:hypothetical protein
MDLPPFALTQREFYGLYEYSTTMPTGQTLGKTWRRRVRDDPQWVIGRYEPSHEPGWVNIGWYRPVVIPNDAVLELRNGLWVGRRGSTYVATASWRWAWAELWRTTGAAVELGR